MRLEILAVPLRLALRIFERNGRLNVPLTFWIGAFSLGQISLVLLGAYCDNTWFLPGAGRGLLQHYGAWSILVSDPFLLLAAGNAGHQFSVALASLPVKADKKSEFARLTDKCLGWIAGKDFAALGFVLCVIVGVFGWLNNIRQTLVPTQFYHHDVFDSQAHLWGFLAYKFCLLISWVVIYPVAGYTIVTTSLSAWIVLTQSRSRHRLALEVTHPDNSFGLAEFGNLAVSLIIPYLLVYGVMATLLITHGAFYNSISVPLVGISLVILTTTALASVPSYLLYRDAKKRTFHYLVSKSSGMNHKNDSDILKFAAERLCYTSAEPPYAGGIKVALFLMNVLPIAGAALSSLGRYLGLIVR